MQMIPAAIQRVGLTGSLKSTLDMIMTRTEPRLTVGYAKERAKRASTLR
jgi:hypothetical protein